MVRISLDGTFIYQTSTLSYYYDPNEILPKGFRIRTFRRNLRYMFEAPKCSNRISTGISIETCKIDFIKNWLELYETNQ